ncbi:hypothetical protein KBD20_02880, partial [Candidatus Saccharibacteria bacterium]|nr:hypothetical protein [Candidatus Saccharibacteria bacterium]
MDSILSSQPVQVGLLLVGLLLARHIIRMYLVTLIRKAVASSSNEPVDAQNKRVDTLVKIVGTLLTIGLIFVGAFILLLIFQVNIMGLLAGLGALGVVVG